MFTGYYNEDTEVDIGDACRTNEDEASENVQNSDASNYESE